MITVEPLAPTGVAGEYRTAACDPDCPGPLCVSDRGDRGISRAAHQESTIKASWRGCASSMWRCLWRYCATCRRRAVGGLRLHRCRHRELAPRLAPKSCRTWGFGQLGHETAAAVRAGSYAEATWWPSGGANPAGIRACLPDGRRASRGFGIWRQRLGSLSTRIFGRPRGWVDTKGLPGRNGQSGNDGSPEALGVVLRQGFGAVERGDGTDDGGRGRQRRFPEDRSMRLWRRRLVAAIAAGPRMPTHRVPRERDHRERWGRGLCSTGTSP